MYELMLKTHFSAAHRLREYEGQCENLHGHNYHVEVVLAGDELDESGMLIDFKKAKGFLKEVMGRLDHEYLNEVEPFDQLNPTTENIARHIAEVLAALLPEGLRIGRVTCWESEKCAARYIPGHAGR
ncbi:MAG: 6-carboxytetrahydropterin synthase QueD [Planctomycetota bacterium]